MLCVFFLSFLSREDICAFLEPATDMSRRPLISSIGSVVNLFVALLWSGRGVTGESLRDLKTDIKHIVT